MKHLEDKSQLIDEARQLERKMRPKIDAGKATNFTEAQELTTFDATFEIVFYDMT